MVCLRPVRQDELECVMNWRMLPEITKYMYTDPKLTMEQQEAWFQRLQEDENNLCFMIEVDRVSAGILNITDIDRKNSRCTWGYYIAVKEKRSLPLALALEWNLYDYVFDVLKLEKLEGEIFAFNKAVLRIHLMCGSVVEGERKRHICKDGVFYDVVETGICRDDWRQMRSKFTYEKIEFITN